MVNATDNGTYKDILNNTYVVPKKDIENVMPNVNMTLKVGNNPDGEFVYIYRLVVAGVMDIVSPLTLKDVTDCGKTFLQFEKDYKRKHWKPIITQGTISPKFEKA